MRVIIFNTTGLWTRVCHGGVSLFLWLMLIFSGWGAVQVRAQSFDILQNRPRLPDSASLRKKLSAPPVTTTFLASASQVKQGGTLVLAAILNIRKGYHVNTGPDDLPAQMGYLIPTQMRLMNPPAWLEVGAVQYPKPVSVSVGYGATPLRIKVLTGKAVLYLPLRVKADSPRGDVSLVLKLTYQACDDRSCFAPQHVTRTLKVKIVDTPASGRANPDPIFEGFEAEATRLPRGSQARKRGVTFSLPGWTFHLQVGRTGGWWLLMLVAALGGMLLNLTPCVLPVIPLKIMALSQSSSGRGRGFLLGVFMSLGVVGFWMALGGAIAAITGFSQINKLFQYPAFSLGVGGVIVVMAVGMCGLFSLRLPRVVYRWVPRHETLAGSVGFGILTAILATPCTGPFMGAAAAWAATQAPGTTLTTFGAIGVGMAFPYLLLSAFPQWTRRIPRAGRVGVLVKQMLGLWMLAAGVYFLGVGTVGLITTPPDPPSLKHWLGVGILLAFSGIWLMWRTWCLWREGILHPRKGASEAASRLDEISGEIHGSVSGDLSKGRLTNVRATDPECVAGIDPGSGPVRGHGFAAGVWMLVGLGIVVGSLWQTRRLMSRGPIPWRYYTPQRFSDIQSRSQAILMDFTAEWCLNCKVLEQQVLNHPKIAFALKKYHVVPMKVDLTASNPDGQARLASTGSLTIPLLVLYGPQGRIRFMADIYTVDQILDALASLKQSPSRQNQNH